MKKSLSLILVLAFIISITLSKSTLAYAQGSLETKVISKCENKNICNRKININSTSADTRGLLYNKFYVSADKASKIGKVLAAGGGAAAVAAYLGAPAVVGVIIAALYGANELCNFNNKGYTVYYSGFLTGLILPRIYFCVPD